MREGLGVHLLIRSESFFWGVIVPSAIFLVSFLVAYALYRKFSPK